MTPRATTSPPHREEIEREPEDVHRGEGRCQGDRQRDGHDKDLAPAAHEQIHDGDDQHRGQEGRVLDAADGSADALALVLRESKLDVTGDFAPELRQASADSIGHADGVGIGLLEDIELHAGASVEAGVDAHVLVVVLHGGDIAEIDGVAELAMRYDEVFDLVETLELPQRSGDDLPGLQGDPSGKHLLVLVAENLSDSGRGEPQCRQALWVEMNADFAFEAADDLDAGRAADGRQALCQPVFGPLPEPHEIALVGVDRDLHDGQLGGIGLDNHRRIHVRREVPGDAPHGGDDVLIGLLDINAALEIDEEGVHALDGGGLQVVQPIHCREDALERLGDVRFDILRRRPLPPDVDLDHGVGDLWQVVDIQLGQAEETRGRHGQGEHPDGDWARQSGSGDLHGARWPPRLPGWPSRRLTWTVAPSTSRSFPETTTSSPEERPART